MKQITFSLFQNKNMFSGSFRKEYLVYSKEVVSKAFFSLLFVLLYIPHSYAQTDNWQRINTGIYLENGTQDLVVKNNCVYIFNGNHSTLVRSTDDGGTWAVVQIPSDSLQHYNDAIHFVNDSTGYVAGYDGGVFSGFGVQGVIRKTTDRGSTWQMLKNGVGQNVLFSHINFFTENHGIAFATGQGKTERYVTTNGGMNWSHIASDPGITMSSVKKSYFTGNQAIAIGSWNNFRAAKSQDGGNTWSTTEYQNTGGPYDLKFFNSASGVFLVADSIFFTSDGAGSFYAKKKFPYASFVKSFEMLDMQKGFFGTSHSIYYTGDGGNTWKLSFMDSALQLGTIKREGNRVFVSTFGDSLVLKLDISFLLRVTENFNHSSMLRIYPNPANDYFRVEIPAGEKILDVVLQDVSGRLIRREELPASETIDIRGLKTGIYLLQIQTGKAVYNGKLVIN